jgi:hypothetical protein
MSFVISDMSEIWKKNNGIVKAINSIHKVLSSAKDNNIIIYSKDLLDELYFQRKIIENIIKNLEKGIKIVFLFNEENEANKSIREFLGSYKDNKNLFYLQIKQEIPLDFIVSDKQYLRIEFDRETHTARFLDTIKNKDESEEANRWINMTYAILTNNIIKTLEEEGKLEQANKLKEFIEIRTLV